jgi:hypothetical protein
MLPDGGPELNDVAEALAESCPDSMEAGLVKIIRTIGSRAKRRTLLATQWARGRMNRGYCTICDCRVWFHETGPWLRDQYVCLSSGSIQRNRALIKDYFDVGIY